MIDCAVFSLNPCLSYTVKPLIFAALNFGDQSNEIILAPLILAFLLAELLVIQYTKLPFEYDDDFIGMAASWLD